MLHDERIDELIEEILESNRTPEEVCANEPGLLAEVHARLRILRALEAHVDSLFPPSQAPTRAHANPPAHVDVTLPLIPDYAVERVLGRGGMGIVYKALHIKLNREVALKMLLSGSYASQQEHLRFVREAESVAALRHPNIVQIYDFGEFDGYLYYTMEYSDGGSLAEKLGGKVQPARDAAKTTSVLARAVHTAHESGIVHRDLKPANILLDREGVSKITDFGLARRLDQESSLTNTGVRVGTPNYMAPEQMAGHSNAFGPAVDIFALGAILYEMLTGQPPFRGNSLSDTERRLAHEEPASPSRLNPKVPRDLETICLKCLEKEPGSRYASAGDLADDLERFLRHEPIHARPIVPAERFLRWIRRNPLPAALAVTSIVLVCLIASQTLDDWSQAAAGRAEKTRLTSRFDSGIELVQSGRFSEARAILGKLGDGGFVDLRERIDRALSDLDLVEMLEAVCIKRSMGLHVTDATWLPNARAATECEALFARAGLGKMADDPALTAKRITASDIKVALIAALDDWAVCESDEARRHWVLQVARYADAGEPGWADRCRDFALWADREELARLAESATEANASVQQLRALGDRLAAAGLDAIAFRARVQQAHIDSFLANLSLADALRPTDPTEAIRYYQAALAIRPQSATAHNNLALALASLGRIPEALVQFEQSLKLDPNSPANQFNMGHALARERPTEAIAHLRRAIELHSKFAAAHRTLGELFLRERRYAEAKSALQACLPLLSDEEERTEIRKRIETCDVQLSQGKR